MLFRSRWGGYKDVTHFLIYDAASISRLAKAYRLEVTESTTYYMGFSASSLVDTLHPSPSPLKSALFVLFFILLFPVSIIEKLFGKGDALYVEIEHVVVN